MGGRGSGGGGSSATSGVLSAAKRIAGPEGSTVLLANLREKIGGKIPREKVDQALRDLDRQGKIMLHPQEDQKALRPRDRAASIRYGDEDMHMLTVIRD